MKTLTSIVAAATLTLGASSAIAGPKAYYATDDSFSTRICHAVANNDTTAVKRLIQEADENSYFIIKGTTCNGVKLIAFTRQVNASDTRRQLHRYLSR